MIILLLVLTALGLHASSTPALASTICPAREQDIINAISNAGSGGTVSLSCASDTTIYFDKANGHNGTGGPITVNKVTLDASSSPGTITLDGGRTAQGGGVQLFDVDVALHTGATLGLKHLTLENGNDANSGSYGGGTVNIADSTVSGSYDSGYGGGAIATLDGNVTVTNSTLSGNSTSSGGGGAIFMERVGGNGRVNITNSTLSGNSSATGGGGAIYNHGGGALTITGSTLSNNSTSSQVGGGAVDVFSGTVNIASSTVSGNSSFDGGAIRNDDTVSVANSTFSGNTATLGGAIENLGILSISGSTLSGNSTPGGGAGGAIDNGPGSVTLDESTIANNSAFLGGAIQNYGTLTAVDSTFSGNSVSGAGSAGGALYLAACTASVAGSIIAGNTGGNCSATVTDLGYNLTDDHGNCGLTGGGDLTNTDPQLGPLQPNGGTTSTMALAATSPAIDRIPSSSSCLFLCMCPTAGSDQRGQARPDAGESTCDIGAYEHHDPVLNCPSSEQDIVDEMSGLGNGGTVDLVCASNTTIYFDTANGHNGNGAPIRINQSVTLDASHSPGTITLDGGHTAQGGGVQLFTVDQGATLGLTKITLQNAGGSSTDNGGAISNAGTVTVTQSTLSGNSTLYSGGAIWNTGTVTVTDSTLANNSADASGGATSNSGTMTITDSTLANNSATSGGAIWTSGTLIVTRSTLAGNSATNGGAMWTGGTVRVGGTIMANNTSGGNCSSSGSITDLGYNLTDANGSCGLTASTDLTGTDPQLGPLQNNGGRTQTVALTGTSRAVDHIPLNAPNGLCSDNGADQRGMNRPDDGPFGGSCDVGAYEYQDAGPVSCPASEQDIVTAIGRLGAAEGTIDMSCPSDTTIFFDNVGGHNGFGGPITIGTTVTLDASSSPGAITLDGGQHVHLFTVNNGATLGLKHLTLTNGSSTLDISYGPTGALVNHGTLNITDSTVSSNHATGSQAQGGAITNTGTLNITRSTLSGNSTNNFGSQGGAMFNGGTASIALSTITGNSSLDGGAIANNGTLTITNSTLAGNSASNYGGIDNGNVLSIGGSIIANNSGTNCHASGTFSHNGTIHDLGYNLTDSDGAQCGLTAGTDLTNTAPRLGTLQDNGGPSQTIPLRLGSPAIDHVPLNAPNSLCPANGTDQDGHARPDDSESTCNVGASESELPAPPTTLTMISGSAQYRGSATLVATLTSAGVPVSGKSITFGLNGTTFCGFAAGVTCPVTDSNGVATFHTISLTWLNVGTESGAVTANFAGDNDYGASGGTGGLTIGKADQTISFGPLPSHAMFDAPFSVSATASSGLAVSYSVGNGDQCTIAGRTVNITGVGSCTVTAAQGGDGNYNPASNVSQTFTIGKATATITIDPNSLSASYDGNPHPVTATTSPSGLSYSVSYLDLLTGLQVSRSTDVGTYSVEADITDPNYQGSDTETLVISTGTQTITFGTLSSHTYGDAPFTVSASSSSGFPVSFSAGSTDQCTVAGNTVTITGAGSCTLTASQGGNVNYNPATSVSQSFTIARAPTTATVTSSVNASIVKQGVTLKVKVTSGAGTPGGTVTITDGATTLAAGVQLDSTGSASVTTAALSAGTHSITASYSGNANFAGVTSSPLIQQVRYSVFLLANLRLSVTIQLQDYTGANVSSPSVTVTAECVVPYSATLPTTCGSAPVQSINKAFGLVNNYRGQGQAYSFSINPKGLTRGQQYYLLVQTGGDPTYHAIRFIG
jgi:hypothetical protein